MFHWIKGEDDFGVDIEQADDFGLCAGLTLKPDTNTNINIEGQFIGDSYLIGAGISFKFGKKEPEFKPRNSIGQRRTTGQQPSRYRATIDPATGSPVITPVEKPEMKLKVDENGEPVKN